MQTSARFGQVPCSKCYNFKKLSGGIWLPCCVAEILGWCKDLPVVGYKDEKGNEYCVFHAPKGKKGVSLAEFNNLIFNRINEIINLNKLPCTSGKKINRSCDLSGTIFEGIIGFNQFNETNPLPEIDFSYAVFGRTVFFKTKFGGKANFSYALFCQKADFSGAEFTGKADFSYSIFFEEAIFSKTVFSDALFLWGEKRKEAGAVDIIGSFGKCMGKDLLKKLKENTDFFSKRLFFDEGDFTGINIKGRVVFESATLEKISFIDTDLKEIDFINCKWTKKSGRDLLYDELKVFEKLKKERKERGLIHWLKHVAMELRLVVKDRKMFPELIGQKQLRLKERFRGNLFEILRRELSRLKNCLFLENDEIKKVEILYRTLKQKYKEEHNEPGVSNWHYGEKEMYRKGSRFRRFFLSNLYWLSSGYGERPVRSGIVLFLLIIGISVLFGLTGIKPIMDNGSVIEIKKWADIWNLDYLKATIEYATLESKPNFIPGNWFLKIAAKLLIPLQAALFALAVRNRFRR
jgi:uncharacterized protein YjbI with pentapeptide repeats